MKRKKYPKILNLYKNKFSSNSSSNKKDEPFINLDSRFIVNFLFIQAINFTGLIVLLKNASPWIKKLIFYSLVDPNIMDDVEKLTQERDKLTIENIELRAKNSKGYDGGNVTISIHDKELESNDWKSWFTMRNLMIAGGFVVILGVTLSINKDITNLIKELPEYVNAINDNLIAQAGNITQQNIDNHRTVVENLSGQNTSLNNFSRQTINGIRQIMQVLLNQDRANANNRPGGNNNDFGINPNQIKGGDDFNT